MSETQKVAHWKARPPNDRARGSDMSKQDRELLELAAKAAGLPIEFGRDWHNAGEPELHGRHWNPLTDDGDALRLAVKLALDILRTERDVEAIAGLPPHVDALGVIASPFGLESLRKDPYAATRRAIVRAAAAIGQSMKEPTHER